MKTVRELVSEYIEAHPEEFERGEHGILVPEGTEAKVLKKWLEGPHGGSLAGSLRGACKADVCAYAEAVLMDLIRDEAMEKIALCVNAFAEWENETTPGPDVVLSCCAWMKTELQNRWQDEGILWPVCAVNLLFCELGILAYHRMETKDAEVLAVNLLLNTACLFDTRKWKRFD